VSEKVTLGFSYLLFSKRSENNKWSTENYRNSGETQFWNSASYKKEAKLNFYTLICLQRWGCSWDSITLLCERGPC